MPARKRIGLRELAQQVQDGLMADNSSPRSHTDRGEMARIDPLRNSLRVQHDFIEGTDERVLKHQARLLKRSSVKQ